MHSWIQNALVLAFVASLFVSEVAAAPKRARRSVMVRSHRRHHAKRAGRHHRRSLKCQASVDDVSGDASDDTSSGDNDFSNDSSSSNSTSSSSSSSTSGLGFSNGLLQKNQVYIGFLPDGGDAGGQRETMAQLNSAIGAKAATYGWYAQAHSGTPFTGGQLLQVLNDVKASGAVFQPAVMPTGGWQGLTAQDNSQAVNICNVMKKFTDEGIPVWLRFAHEMNWYQSDGTYQGNAADFKAGWAAVAKACKQIAPDVKMFWTPNIASMDSYAKYEPDDMSTVDLVGIDFYPHTVNSNTFVNAMKAFHDKYAVNGRKFAIGETGLGYAGSVSDRMNWLQQIINARDQLPEMTAISWFNYYKGYDFRICGSGNTNSQLQSLLAI